MDLLTRYATVLKPAGAAQALTASIVGRLSLGMTGLGTLLLVRDTTGSYAAAGLVTAAYALSFAVGAPGRARSADRIGPRRVLVTCGLLHPAALAALVALCAADAGLALLVLAAAAAGATLPPHGAVMRALWGTMLGGPALATAYALEAVVVELCFVLGPLLVAILVGLSGTSAVVLVSAGLASVGALWLAAVPRVRDVAPHPARATSFFGPLVSPVVRSLLVTVLFIGVGFGGMEVAVPAFVEAEGSARGMAGVLLAVWSLGSVLGGIAYTAVHPQARPTRQLPLLVAALSVGSLLPVLAGGIGWMALALLAYGSAIAPFSACNSVLLGGNAPAGTVTEAFAWNGSMIFGGAALGSGVAGVLVEASGATAALAVTAVAGVLTLGSSLWGLRALRTST